MAEVVRSPVSYQAPSSAGRRVTVSPHPPSAGSRPSPPAGSRISSGHGYRIGTPKTPDDRLSPAPEYMRPIAQSASRRWKKQEEQVMMDQLVDKWDLHKDANRHSRDEARKIARKIPMEILAKDWLNMEGATVETRAFLVDKVLPTLILGVEKLLLEVDKKDLADTTEPDNNFNPLNFLAQYLMRNNPRYSNFSEASPYIRGLREIAEQLKGQLFEYEDNRLARIKAEAKRKREEREKVEQLRQVEKSRREEALRKQFLEWNVGTEGKVELALLQNALRSFMEIAEQYPDELRNAAQYSQELEPTDDTGKAVAQFEFSGYLNQFITDIPSDIFDQFLLHLSRCARTYRTSSQKDVRRAILAQVFSTCDHNEIGQLDRHRILNLFEMFWDKLPERIKNAMRNPRGWPVVEVDEVASDFSDIEDEEESKQDIQLIDNNKDITHETKDDEKQRKNSTGSVKDEKTDNAEPPKETAVEEAQETDIISQAEDATDHVETGQDEKGTTEPTCEANESQEQSNEPETEDVKNKEKDTEENGNVEQSKAEENASEENASEEKASDEKASDVKDEAQIEEAMQDQDKETEGQKEEKTEKLQEEQKDENEGKNEEKKEENSAGDKTTEVVEDKNETDKQVDQTTEQSVSFDDAQKDETDQKPAPSSVDNQVLLPDEQKQDTSVLPSDEHEQVPGEPTTIIDKEKASSEMPGKEQDAAVVDINQDEAVVDMNQDEAVVDMNQDAAVVDMNAVEADEQDGIVAMMEPPLTAEKPPMTQQSKVSFADGTTFDREKTMMTSTSHTRSHSQASAFDESSLNVSQFVQVTESFLGDDPTLETFDMLIDFIGDGYVETEEEKMDRLMKAKKEERTVKRRVLLNNLFEMWDNDGSGFLDVDEVETVMKKYKDNQEEEAIQAAKKTLKKKFKHHDMRLSKREFREFVHKVAEHMPGEEAFDSFVEFLVTCVEKSYTERMRGEARKKWLKQIITAAETGGARMEPVYKSVFQSLYKDAETHGGGKKVSANISLLENNDVAPSRGATLLRYVAATPDDAPYLLGHCLHQDMKGISFASVETGKPIHVPRVNNHGNIYFWNTDRFEEDRDGSFIVVPLKDRNKRVFGLLGIDTLNDPHTRAIFITHEIQFFQGIAKAFSIAYHFVDVRRKTMQISESAVSWIHRRCTNIHEITVYMVEPENKTMDYVLRKMMSTDERGNAISLTTPPRLERKDNLFRDYLFRCVDNSESVTADAYGERHLSFPLRDEEGKAIVVVDISIGNLKKLPKSDQKEVMRMLKLMQMAYREITRESREGEKTVMLEAEQHEDNRVELLFDRLMLVELRENVAKLDGRAYAELKSYKEPPKIIHLVLKAVLSVIHPEHSDALDNWVQCKNFLNTDLSHKIVAYDPTGIADERVPVDKVKEYLSEVPHGAVDKHGSMPAKHLYSWVFVCISLIEHTRRMEAEQKRDNRNTEEKEKKEEKEGEGEKGENDTGGNTEEANKEEVQQQTEQPTEQTQQES